ncbi:MAG: hypothetical protein QOH58_2142 [Thermoleophilaceae bacterium]|jgi:hypothetical protein|nr:hypothetical protein [Thermoleophilaceae bacterium]
MSSQAEAGRAFDLPLTWVEFDEVPILFANHFLVQQQPDEFVVTLGQVTGPPLIGTPEQINQQLGQLTEVPINTLARVGLTRHRVSELISILQAAVEDHDRTLGR